jgi:hypothetical protein
MELQYAEGQVKFVADFLLNRLPEGELIPEEVSSDDE